MRSMTVSQLRELPLWLRLAGSAVFMIAVFALSIALGFPQQGARYLLLYPAVLACAFFGGREAGYAATFTAVLAVTAYLGVTWTDQRRLLIDGLSVLLFICIGLGMAEVLSRLKEAMGDLEQAYRQLQDAHAAAQASEEQTDLLLRELTHRTRNDIANLVAILRLQARGLEGEAKQSLLVSADRLQVLAKVHQKLSRQGHSPTVEVRSFLQDLTSDLRSTLLPLKPVAVETDIAELELPARRAVPLGLIFNELLTNAVKYAYPDGRDGVIQVRLIADEETVTLQIVDDGVGIKPNSGGTGLGHRLVRSLTAQLGGSFECDSGGEGTRCRMWFPRNHAS